MNIYNNKIIIILSLISAVLVLIILLSFIFNFGNSNKVKQPKVYSEGNKKVLIVNWGKHLGEVYFQKNAGGVWIGPKDYTLDQEGNIYILESNPDIKDLTRIQKFDQNGKFVLSSTLDPQIAETMPTDRALGGGGQGAYVRVFNNALYLITENMDSSFRVIKYNTEGKYLKTLVHKQRELNADVYISPFFDAKGNLYLNIYEKQTGNEDGGLINKQIKITPEDKVVEEIFDREKEGDLFGVDKKSNIYRSIPNKTIVYSKEKEKIKEIDRRPLYGENLPSPDLLNYFRMDFNGDIYSVSISLKESKSQNIEIIKFNQNLDRIGHLLIPRGGPFVMGPPIIIYPSLSSNIDAVFLLVRYNIDKKQVYIEKYNL